MRSGKMTENVKRNLTSLLEVVRSPLTAWRIGSYYKVGYYFRDEDEADDFRKLLLFNVGFNRNHVETFKTYRKPGYIIYVRWHASKQEELIKNIEEYLQEDNMGPTNINRENTKFYAIVEDAEGKKTAYEIQHPSLTSRMECCFGESTITHTVEFDQDYMKKCDCVFTEWAKQKDELDKLRAEKDALAKRLGEREDQLKCAMDRLDVYENTDHTFSVFDRTKNQKKVAEDIRDNLIREAAIEGASSAKDLKLLGFELTNDCIERIGNSTVNAWSLSHPRASTFGVDTDAIYMDTSGFVKSVYFDNGMRNGKMKTLSEMMAKRRLNSMYGEYCANDIKVTKEMLKKSGAFEWNSNGETTPHIKINVYDSIKDVMFANPATIVFWKDGTKTRVCARGGDVYNPEVGLAMCICKKLMGNKRDYYHTFLHWMKRAPKEV